MHINFVDPYKPSDSPIHRLAPRVKFLTALVFIVATALMPTGAWPIYLLLLSLTVSVAVLSELRVSFLMKRSAVALPFALAAVTVIFTTPGTAWFQTSLGPWLITATGPGVVRFLSIVIKSWLSVQAAILLSATTSFPDLLVAMRAVHIPRLLVAIFAMMWRYLFVLSDEALRLMRAREARSASDGLHGRPGGSLMWRGKVTGGMVGSLFVRSLERGERIHAAMTARGYDGEVRTLSHRE
ncbi:MAG: cobalt ECF transporter T component CbiQ [Chloroflexota bacterium]|nr:cobalt ECF transporter T component CbiQ [Chloroflexota bacterium]